METRQTSATLTVFINGTLHTVSARCTIADLLRDREIRSEGTAVAVNDAVIARSRHAQHVLHDSDRIEILHAVAGG
jgi:sulfur carrier protein